MPIHLISPRDHQISRSNLEFRSHCELIVVVDILEVIMTLYCRCGPIGIPQRIGFTLRLLKCKWTPASGFSPLCYNCTPSKTARLSVEKSLLFAEHLGTVWTKHFCQYRKEDRKFTMIPYSQHGNQKIVSFRKLKPLLELYYFFELYEIQMSSRQQRSVFWIVEEWFSVEYPNDHLGGLGILYS